MDKAPSEPVASTSAAAPETAQASQPPSAAPSRPLFAGSRACWLGLGVLAAAAVVVILGFNLFRPERNGHAKDLEEEDNGAEKAGLFAGWRKPDFVIVFTGQSMGYVQPCGCSSPQYGGLARRFSFLKSLKDKDWPVVAMDLGDMASGGSTQAVLKYQVIMNSLKAMGYGVVGLGKAEYMMPLPSALSQHTLDNPEPRVVATSLNNTEPEGIWHRMNVRRSEVIRLGVYNIGVISVVSDKVARDITNLLPPREKLDINFAGASKALEEGLKDLKKKDANISVLLFHGDEKEAANFVADAHKLYLAGQAPLLHAVLCLDKYPDPGSVPVKVVGIPTQIISVGQKGKNAGVLGFFRNPTNLEMRYQLVQIGPQFEPKEGDEKSNPVLAIMQKYADDVKKRDFLKLADRTTYPTQLARPEAFYVGSDACKSCHKEAYKIWQNSAHAHAYTTLEKTKFPTGRQFDPECIVCHTVGFGKKTGFWDPPTGSNPIQIKDHNVNLRHVGCESCHGPCSDHVDKSRDATLYPLINPWRPKGKEDKAQLDRRLQLIEWNLCLKCHDEENDVHWGDVGFHGKWFKREIYHPSPRKKAAEAPTVAPAP